MAHFYAGLPDQIRALTTEQAVAAYVGEAARPAEAIAGLTAAQLDAEPVPGTWSIRQIVLHLADTDQIASYRMKRIIAEDDPAVDVYDENAFVTALDYTRQDAAKAAELFRLNRELTGAVLTGLPAAVFERSARHPEIGPMTLGQFLRLYVHHLRHHMGFLERKRAMVAGAG